LISTRSFALVFFEPSVFIGRKPKAAISFFQPEKKIFIQGNNRAKSISENKKFPHLSSKGAEIFFRKKR